MCNILSESLILFIYFDTHRVILLLWIAAVFANQNDKPIQEDGLPSGFPATSDEIILNGSMQDQC